MKEEDLTTPEEERPPRDNEPSEDEQEGANPVNVELVGGTAATNKWHDHRVMLVSPEIADYFRGLVEFLGANLSESATAFLAAFDAAPRVHADDDAIRWLTNRQGDAT